MPRELLPIECPELHAVGERFMADLEATGYQGVAVVVAPGPDGTRFVRTAVSYQASYDCLAWSVASLLRFYGGGDQERIRALVVNIIEQLAQPHQKEADRG